MINYVNEVTRHVLFPPHLSSSRNSEFRSINYAALDNSTDIDDPTYILSALLYIKKKTAD